jgi:CheY-like chemotaxis protein
METHEGAITVESRLGEGTVFRLYFPAQTGVVAPGAPETEATPRGGGERILFVDDEELLGRLGQLTLAELGYAVEYTTDAQAAIDLVRADPARFDLVITDQTMPRITGLSLAAELHHIRPELPVILTTGYSQSLAPEKVEAAGVTKILYKPVEVRDLGNAVREALGSRLPR